MPLCVLSAVGGLLAPKRAPKRPPLFPFAAQFSKGRAFWFISLKKSNKHFSTRLLFAPKAALKKKEKMSIYHDDIFALALAPVSFSVLLAGDPEELLP